MNGFCCDKPRHVGCFTHCQIVHTGLLAAQTGEHTLVWRVGERQFSVAAHFEAGEPLRFDNVFNENAYIPFYILQPDNTRYADDDDRTCFAFTSRVGRALGGDA